MSGGRFRAKHGSRQFCFSLPELANGVLPVHVYRKVSLWSPFLCLKRQKRVLGAGKALPRQL